MPWTGQKDSGSREYKDGERDRVVRLIREEADGKAHARSVAYIAKRTALEARTVRQILSDRDGHDFLLCSTPEDGVFMVEYAEEAEGTTRKLLAQAQTIMERVERRRQFADGVPRRQPELFAETPAEGESAVSKLL